MVLAFQIWVIRYVPILISAALYKISDQSIQIIRVLIIHQLLYQETGVNETLYGSSKNIFAEKMFVRDS